jgi:hypothetical protein
MDIKICPYPAHAGTIPMGKIVILIPNTKKKRWWGEGGTFKALAPLETLDH